MNGGDGQQPGDQGLYRAGDEHDAQLDAQADTPADEASREVAPSRRRIDAVVGGFLVAMLGVRAFIKPALSGFGIALLGGVGILVLWPRVISRVFCAPDCCAPPASSTDETP